MALRPVRPRTDLEDIFDARDVPSREVAPLVEQYLDVKPEVRQCDIDAGRWKRPSRVLTFAAVQSRPWCLTPGAYPRLKTGRQGNSGMRAITYIRNHCPTLHPSCVLAVAEASHTIVAISGDRCATVNDLALDEPSPTGCADYR